MQASVARILVCPRLWVPSGRARQEANVAERLTWVTPLFPSLVCILRFPVG